MTTIRTKQRRVLTMVGFLLMALASSNVFAANAGVLLDIYGSQSAGERQKDRSSLVSGHYSIEGLGSPLYFYITGLGNKYYKVKDSNLSYSENRGIVKSFGSFASLSKSNSGSQEIYFAPAYVNDPNRFLIGFKNSDKFISAVNGNHFTLGKKPKVFRIVSRQEFAIISTIFGQSMVLQAGKKYDLTQLFTGLKMPSYMSNLFYGPNKMEIPAGIMLNVWMYGVGNSYTLRHRKTFSLFPRKNHRVMRIEVYQSTAGGIPAFNF